MTTNGDIPARQRAWHAELVRRALKETDDVGEAFCAAELAIAEQPFPPVPVEAAFSFDIRNRRGQGILNRALAAAKKLSGAARTELEAVLSPDASMTAQRIRDVIGKYRLQLADLLSGTQLAALLEGAREVASKLPPTFPAGASSAPPPALPPEGAWLSPEGIHYPVISEAARDLAQRNLVSPKTFARLDAATRQKAFSVAEVDATETLSKVLTALSENVRKGADYETYRKEILASLDEGTFLSAGHQETVFRTNIQSALSDGQMGVLQHPVVRSGFPYASYEAIHDDRVREEHLSLEKYGIGGSNIYRLDDPVFQTFRAPWDYNCRCGWIPLTVRQAAEHGVAEAQRWLAEGVEPSPPAFVPMPPFSPPPGFQRAVSAAPVSVQMSLEPLTVWGLSAAFGWNSQEQTWSGPNPPGNRENWVPVAPGPRGGKKWKYKPGAGGKEQYAPRAYKRGTPRAAAGPERPKPEDVTASVQQLIGSGQPITAEQVEAFAAQFMQMRVVDIHQVKKALQLKASGRKVELAKKVAERAMQQVRTAPATPQPAPQPPLPAAPPAPSAGAKSPERQRWETDLLQTGFEQADLDEMTDREVGENWVSRSPGATRQDVATVHAAGEDKPLTSEGLASANIEPDAAAKIKQIFGKDVSADELGSLVGAQTGSHLEVSAPTTSVHAQHGGLQVFAQGHNASYQCTREIYRDRRGKLVCYNSIINVRDTGHGLGTKIFADQVESLRKAGFSKIVCMAAGNKRSAAEGGFNGYKTWASLGYDGVIPKRVREKLPTELKANKVQELMSKPGGRQWWNENGTAFNGTFDLTPGSTSSKVLSAYLEAKSGGQRRTGGAAEPAGTAQPGRSGADRLEPGGAGGPGQGVASPAPAAPAAKPVTSYRLPPTGDRPHGSYTPEFQAAVREKSAATTPEQTQELLSAWDDLDKTSGGNNYVSLVDLRQKLGWDRATFDGVFQRARSDGTLAGTAAEGRGGIKPEQEEAGIPEDQGLVLYAQRRQSAAKQPARPTTDPGKATARVQQLYQQAIEPSTTLEGVESAINDLRGANLPKAQLDDLARKMGIGRRLATRDEAIKAIRQKILSIKGTWDRKDA